MRTILCAQSLFVTVGRNMASDNIEVDEGTSIDTPDFGQMCRVS